MPQEIGRKGLEKYLGKFTEMLVPPHLIAFPEEVTKPVRVVGMLCKAGDYFFLKPVFRAKERLGPQVCAGYDIRILIKNSRFRTYRVKAL